MIKRRIIFVIVCLLATVISYGQEQEKDKFLITSVGGGYSSLLDEGISPLFYSGAGGSAAIGLSSQNEKNRQQFLVKFNFNVLTTERSGGEIYAYNTSGHYQYFFNNLSLLSDSQKAKLIFGLEANFNIAIRNHQFFTNNALHIDNRLALAPAFYFEWPFKLFNQDFSLSSTMSLPLLNYAVRPLFASTRLPSSIGNTENNYADYFKGGDIISWGSYFKIKNQLRLQYLFKTGNGISVDYHWFYESYNALNPIKAGQHSLMISTLFQL